MLWVLCWFVSSVTVKRQCHYEIVVENTFPQLYSFPMDKGSTLCLSATKKNTAIVFEKAERMTATVYWNINGYSHFVEDIEDLENISVYDFSHDVGEMQITSIGSETISFMTMAFPFDCGAHRFVASGPSAIVGLSSSIRRRNFVSNNEKMCVWYISSNNFQYRIPPHISGYGFELSNCLRGKCTPANSRKWQNADRLSYFELDNQVDFYSAIFSVEFRSRDPSEYVFDVLLDESNFTMHKKRIPSNAKHDERHNGFIFLFIIVFSICCGGFLIILFALICEVPDKVHTYERESFLNRPLQTRDALSRPVQDNAQIVQIVPLNTISAQYGYPQL